MINQGLSFQTIKFNGNIVKKLFFRKKEPNILERTVKCCLLNGAVFWTSIIIFENVVLPAVELAVNILTAGTLYKESGKKSSLSETHRRPHFIGDPTCRFNGDPNILIGDPNILLDDPYNFIGDPNIFICGRNIFMM